MKDSPGRYSYKCNYDTKKVATYRFGVCMHFNSQSDPHFSVKPTSQLASYVVAVAIAIASHGLTCTGVCRWRP